MKNKCRFKKIYISLLIIIVFISAFMLGACSITKTTAKSASDFDIKCIDTLGSHNNLYILTDKKYQKDYIIIQCDTFGSVAITPRLED